MKCYRVWFKGGSVIAVDAIDRSHAMVEALARRQYDDGPIVRVECLD